MSTKYQGGFTTVTIGSRRNINTTITAEKTGHPGLVIAPGVANFEHNDAPCFKGWTITHVPSGMKLPQIGSSWSLDDVRTVARTLTETDIDWSRPAKEIVADEHVKEAILTACAPFSRAARRELTDFWAKKKSRR